VAKYKAFDCCWVISYSCLVFLVLLFGDCHSIVVSKSTSLHSVLFIVVNKWHWLCCCRCQKSGQWAECIAASDMVW